MKPDIDALKVCAERCDQCLFSPQRIVSITRMQQILDDCDTADTCFECHKHTLRKMDDPHAAEAGVVVCRGFYDRNPHGPLLLRMGALLNLVTFVDESGEEAHP